MKYILISILSVINIYASKAFIEPHELLQSMQDDKTIVIDVSSLELYKKSHILNAIHCDISKLINKKSKYNLSNPINVLEEHIKDLGINSDSYVIIYARNSEEDFLNSSYLAFILIKSGFENISILNGGYMAWVFEHELYTSNNDSHQDYIGDFKILNNENIVVDSEYVEDSISKIPILDSRSTPYYYGTKRSKGIKSIGHIPNASSSYYKDKFLSDMTIRDKKSLEDIFIKGHELKKSDEVILYSDNIFESSMNWYILYKHLGFNKAKIYEASLLEWGNSGFPVVRFKWEGK